MEDDGETYSQHLNSGGRSMKRPALALLGFFALAVAAWPQEIFDLLRKGDAPSVKALIEKSPQLVSVKDPDGDTPLHYAAVNGDAAFIDFLVEKGAKLDAVGAGAKTPLQLAALYDRREAVAALIKRGAAVDIKDNYQRTALVLCARERG